MRTYKTPFWKSDSTKVMIFLWVFCGLMFIAISDIDLPIIGLLWITAIYLVMLVWFPISSLNHVTIMDNCIIVEHSFFDSWGGVYKYADITKIIFRFPHNKMNEADITIHRKNKRNKYFPLDMVSSSDYDNIICDLVRNGVVVEVIYRPKKLVIPEQGQQ